MFRSFTIVVPILCLASSATSADERIVPEGASLEHLFTRSVALSRGLTEGPAAAPDGSIWFSDIASGEDRGRILRFDPRTKKVSVILDDSRKSNGLAFDTDGKLIICEGADYGGRRISLYDPATGERSTICENFEGKRFNAPNDLCLDRKGRIYFTDPRYVGPEPRELEHRSVYRIGADRKAVLVTKDVDKPNGIALSPDGRTLYVADHDNGTDQILPDAPPSKPGAMKIYAFPLDEGGDVSGERKTLIDFGAGPGIDGMTVDVKGHLYLSLRDPHRPGIVIVDPGGKELGFVATGAPGQEGSEVIGLPSNCAFGIGSESNVLYVTVDKRLYRVRLRHDGFRRPNRTQRALLTRFRREFVKIGPGLDGYEENFRMGRADGPAKEKPPIHLKMKGRRFEMGVYEVPQDLWQAVMGHNPSRWKGPRNSAEMLSFDEARDFCRNATELLRVEGLIESDQRVRLPSEAEWEYCARAGTKTLYSFGDDIGALGDYAWSTDNAAGNDPPVGAKKPNPWKLYDVHGYLWEWCEDVYAPDLSKHPRDGSPLEARDGEALRRVLRGGSWKDKAEMLASSYRREADPETRDTAVGLRCVISR